MEKKPIKTFLTTCPFPVLQYDVNVVYNEVRKASGFAYILLVLIKEASMRKERVADVLKRFGIPADLHHLFANELSKLLETDILTFAFGSSISVSDMRYFEQLELGWFSMTEKGKKMFAEGAIPTENEKSKPASLFFDPVSRSFTHRPQSSVPLKTTFLGDDFMENVEYDISGREDYVKSIKPSIGLKSEEMVVRIEDVNSQNLAVRKSDNMKIIISKDGVTFSFDTTNERAFFEKYYTTSLMTLGMLSKTKYKFSQSVPTLPWETINADALHIPNDAQKQASRPCKIFLNRGTQGFNGNSTSLKYPNATPYLDILGSDVEFALLDILGCKLYRPLNIAFPCTNLAGTFELQMLVEATADKEQLEKLLMALYENCKAEDVTREKAQTVAYIATMFHDPSLLSQYAMLKLSPIMTEAEKIDTLLLLNREFEKCEGWKTQFEFISKQLFERCISSVTFDSTEFRSTILRPLQKAMGMTENAFIGAFAEKLLQQESADLVYQALENANFAEADILPLVNVTETYLKCVLDHSPIDAKTTLAKKYTNLSANLWKLCDMLGVDNPDDYTLRDDYSVDMFFDTYTTYKNAKNAIEPYKAYAQTLYLRLNAFDEIFDPIHETLTSEKIASQHPEHITRKVVDQDFNKGNWIPLISNLLIKAQYDLRKRLEANASMQANELIDEAKARGIVDDSTANALHRLRMVRNRFQHPEKNRISFTRDDVKKWIEIVFSLKEEKVK